MMDRRTFLKTLAFGAASASFPSFVRAAAQKNDRPNIVLFITDDQVKEEIACYGGKVLTPNLDRLAREGMRLDNAHVVSCVCTPSRYSLFTGRYPGNSYFKPYLEEFPRNRHGAPGFNVGLEEDNMNVGNVLRLSGYVTGHVGKLHVGPDLKRPGDFTSRGLYDASAKTGVDPDSPDVISGWRSNELWYRKWIINHGFSWAKHVYWGNIKHPYGDHNPEWTLEAALEFIDENQDKPFYLHYTTTLMHGGPNGWKRSLEKPLSSGAGKLDKLPDVIPSRSEIKAQVDRAGFDESTYGFTWMDATVGAMLDKLDKLGIANNTLFVFVSDHGTEGKWSLHDHNGTNIPAIIRWPKVIKPGSVCNSLVQTTDLVPTFFDIAGANIPQGYRIDGTSIKPILSNPTAKVHDHLYFELGYARAVRTQDWKYIAVRYGAERFAQIERAALLNLPGTLAYIGRTKNAANHLARRPHYLESDQLYRLSDDPLEMKNLARNPQFNEQLAKLRGLLMSDLKAQHRPFGEFVPGEDSVPVVKLQPYIERLKMLRPIKRGFEVINSAPSETRSKPDGRAVREKRRKARQKRNKNNR
ncbi:MAG: sulfatase family protein [Planctomycetota bacterium]|jgi:arylsulfatase A-like enzyme